jgi:CubicO group peptidase (beta-lactamase class C family)
MHRLAALIAAVLALVIGGLTPAVAQHASPAASPAVSLAGVRPLPLTGARAVAFETFVADLIARAEIPGAAVAVVQDGEVVYAQGFGVKALGHPEPVTPDTLMLVGSTQKSMTSLLAATLVDAGKLRWDTPLTDLLPDFATADPALTARLTVADAFCACTGLPRQDLELMFNGAALTAEELVASVADIAPVAPFGEAFQYSNQLYATGGYAVAAAGGATADLHAAYVTAMRERVLDPIGMQRSTFAFDETRADGDHAAPHGRDLAGAYHPLPIAQEEEFITPVAPAGGLWSSAPEMARYLQTVIDRGVAPDGARVVSTENLEATWTQRVALSPEDFPSPTMAAAYAGYGLGWGVGDYKGQPMLSHTGSTLGFSSALAAWPDAGLGIVILTNGQGADYAAQAVQFHLIELLFGQPAELAPLATQAVAAAAQQTAALGSQLGDRVDPAAVAPYLGRYRNPSLGEVSLALRDGALILDAGEVRSELLPRLDEQGRVTAYVAIDPPLTRLPLAFASEGGSSSLMIPNPATGAPYVFEPVPGSTPSTPAP